MTTTTIANLPVLTVMTDSDAIPVDTGSNTYQISGANLKNYFGNVSLISNGTSYANIASSNGNVVISANGSGWTFDTNGDITMPLVTKLNSGGIGNTNVAEFGTDVTVDGGGNVITSEIYMGAGTAESRAIVNTLGNSLMYIGVENPGFAGSVSLDPGVTSEYAIQVGSNHEIQIGAVIGAITTTEYVAGMGVLNATGNINGLFANANVAVIGVDNQGWLFGSDGTLELPVIDGYTGIIKTANAYPELLAYGSDGVMGIHGGPELDWMNSDDPANTFANVNTLRNTLYINGGGLYVGINENGNIENFSGSLTFNSTDGNLTAPGNVVATTFVTSGAGGDITLTNGNITGANVVSSTTISATGNITGAHFFGNGAGLTDVGTASVPSQNILPTIQTITAIPMLTGYLGGGEGGVTVTVANIIPVTEYGVIVTDGTVSQKYATGALGSIPGTGNITFTTGTSNQPFTVYAYVTSNAGTYYSDAVTGTSGQCILTGTQIALSDGSHKAIEDITYTDKILSWDFDRGCYAETSALWIKISDTGSQYNLLTFSDGTTLRTFDQHRIFNKQAGAFTYPMTDATPIGTITVNEHGQEITLINKQVIVDNIEYYNVITDYHMNLFSDSVLTSCRFNNIYPITNMKFVKDARTLRTRDEFENIPDRFFYGLRLAEQTTDIETVEWYVNRLLLTEMLTKYEITV